MEWELHTPYQNPPDVPPGWYFVTFDRNHDLYSCGPYPSSNFCLRVIGTEKPCYSCEKCPVYYDVFDDDQSPSVKRAQERWGVVLCKLCTRDFKKWHKKTHGRPPSTLDIVPKAFTIKK